MVFHPSVLFTFLPLLSASLCAPLYPPASWPGATLSAYVPGEDFQSFSQSKLNQPSHLGTQLRR